MPVSFDIHENEYLEGIYQEGVAKGQRDVLIDFPEEKFGTLAPELKQRIEKAPVADVQRWSRRLLSATVDEIFQ